MCHVSNRVRLNSKEGNRFIMLLDSCYQQFIGSNINTAIQNTWIATNPGFGQVFIIKPY